MLEDYWVAIERIAAIQSTPAAFIVSDQSIVLVRAADGDVIALEDRCPHRDVPLSLGRVGPHGLTCRFHGWTFDGRGRCTSMPGMSSELIAEVRVRHYETRELHGLLWISRSLSARMPECLRGEQNKRDMRFLWERRYRESAAGLQSRLSEKHFSDGSMVQIEARAPLGCEVQVTLCITPETAATCRVFALAHVDSQWLPNWLAQKIAASTLNRISQPATDLGGLPIADRS